MTFSFLYTKLSHPSDILTNLVKELLRMAWSYFSFTQFLSFELRVGEKKKESGSRISHQPVPVITNQQWLLVRSYSTLEPVCSVRSARSWAVFGSFSWLACFFSAVVIADVLGCSCLSDCRSSTVTPSTSLPEFSCRASSGCFLWGGNAV